MRIEDIKENYVLLNKGAGRSVYDLKDGNVIKIPKVNFYHEDKKVKQNFKDFTAQERGIVLQSIIEYYVYTNCPKELLYLLCPISNYFFIGETPIIYMPKLNTITSKQIKDYRKYSSQNRLLCLFMDKDFSDYEIVERDIKKLCAYFFLEEKELLTNWRNWGYNNFGFQVLDYGYLKKPIWIEVVKNGLQTIKNKKDD